MDKKRLNIGLFIDTWYPMVDGVITVVENYAKLLSAMGHNVTVFCPNVGVSEDKRDYRIVKCKSMKLLGLDYSLPLPNSDKKFKKEIKESNLDIIHIHSPFFVEMCGVAGTRPFSFRFRQISQNRASQIVHSAHCTICIPDFCLYYIY